MDKIAEMKKLQAAQAKEARAIMDKATAEKRGLTAEEKTKVDEIMASIDARKAQIELEERMQATERELGVIEEPTAGRPDPAIGADGKPAARSARQHEVRVMTMGKDGRLIEGREIDPKKEFRTLGELLQAVAKADSRHGVDPRLSETRAVSGLNEAAPSDGGWLVQKDFSIDLMTRTYATGSILSRIPRIPVGPNSNGLNITMINETSRANGSRWGGVVVSRQPEGGSPAAGKPKFRQMELKLKKLFGLCYATDELLQDAVALEAVINKAFPDEMSFVMEDEIINGNGAGQMLGFLNSLALISVAKETGQAAATILYENIVKMWSRMFAPSRKNAVWLINQDCEPQLNQMQLVIGTGGVPVYLQPGGISETPFARLMGREVLPIEQCQTVGTTGDIMLLDLSQYTMIDKGGIQAASSVHVRFINDEMTYRFIARNDGQPTWNSALTPKNGSNTLSPYVALATR